MEKVRIQVTIFFEKRYYVGTFERIDKEGYSVAKHIFGAEPSDPEIYDFVLHHFNELNFGTSKDFSLVIKRKNPKRVQREIRKEIEKIQKECKPSTYAEDYMREELEKHKKVKKKKKSIDKQEEIKQKFSLKQIKKKKKHRGR